MRTRNTHQLLLEETAAGDVPLVCQDNEEYQKELDTTCRKLYRFMASQKSGR